MSSVTASTALAIFTSILTVYLLLYIRVSGRCGRSGGALAHDVERDS